MLTYKHIRWKLDALPLKGHFRRDLLPLKGQRNHQSHVKGNLVTQRKTNAIQTALRLVLAAGELSKDEYRSGDRSGTWKHEALTRKGLDLLSGLCPDMEITQ